MKHQVFLKLAAFTATILICAFYLLTPLGTLMVVDHALGAGQFDCLVEQTDTGYLVETANTSRYYSDANAAIDAGLSSLSVGRTQNQIVALKGSFQLQRQITLPRYTTVNMYEATLIAARNYGIMFNATKVSNIVLQGGFINGSKRIEHAIDFCSVNYFTIKDLNVTQTWGHSVYLESCRYGSVINVEVSHAELIDAYGRPVGQDGFAVTKLSSNITFDRIYVHDIWMERTLRPNYDMWGGGVEIMAYPGAEPKNIEVLNSTFKHLGEFGIGLESKNGTGLHVYNIEIMNNSFENIGKEAIDACYLMDSEISGNVINRTEKYGIQIYAANSSANDVEVKENTITNAGYLSGITVAGINTDGAGNLTNIKVTNNKLRCQVGLRLIPRVLSAFVDGNDFNTCATDVLTWSKYVTWGTNINQNGIAVSSKQP